MGSAARFEVFLVSMGEWETSSHDEGGSAGRFGTGAMLFGQASSRSFKVFCTA